MGKQLATHFAGLDRKRSRSFGLIEVCNDTDRSSVVALQPGSRERRQTRGSFPEAAVVLCGRFVWKMPQGEQKFDGSRVRK